jgi:hypothetical protein
MAQSIPVNTKAVMIAATNVQGMRKCKHFSLTVFASTNSTAAADRPIFWALVYVPEGMTPNDLNLAGDPPATPMSIYEPNQYMIASGIAYRYQASVVRTVTGRNLNSGDSVYLITQIPSSDVSDVQPSFLIAARLNFAIAY